MALFPRSSCLLGVFGLGALCGPPVLAQTPRCRVAEVEVPAVTVRVGERAPLIIVFRDASGIPCQDDPNYTVTSSNVGIARIDSGRVVGVAAGTAAIAVRTTGATPAMGAGVVVVTAAAAEAVVPPAPPPITTDAPGSARPVVEPQARGATPPAAIVGAATTTSATAAAGAAALARQPPGSATPEALVLRPVVLVLLPGERVELRYHVVGAAGVPAIPQPLVFSATGTVAVDSLGVVTAGSRPGPATVSVVSPANPALSGQVVASVAADSVAFDRSAVTLRVGLVDTLHLVVPSQARLLPLESRLFSYQSSDSAVVAVRGDAPVITARAPGRATIRARHMSGMGDVTASVIVGGLAAALSGPRDSVLTVVRGRFLPLSVRALAADSSPVATPLTWSVADTTVATVDAAAARLRGVAAGATTVTVGARGSGGPLSRRWRVRVLSGGLEVVPQRLGLRAGASGAATVWHRGGEQQVVPADVSWSGAGDAVMVAPGGEIRAVQEGRARVTARAAWDSAATLEVFVVPELLTLLRRGGQTDVYAGSAAAPTARRLAGDPLLRVAFAWSPDRTRLAVVARVARGRPADLYVMDVDGGGVRKLTDDSADVTSAVFTPGGDRIVFASGRGGTSRLYSVRVDGTGREAIATPRAASWPAVSTDGNLLVYASDGLYAVALDGSGERRLTANAHDRAPRFAPDGRNVMFLRDEGVRTTRLYRLPLAVPSTPVAVTPDGMQVDDFDVNPTGQPLLCLVVSAINRSTVSPTLGVVGGEGRFATAALERGDEVLGCRFRP